MSDDDLNVTISEDGPDSSATEDLLNVVVEDSFSSDDLDAQISEDDLDVSTQEDSLTISVGDMGLIYHNKTSGKQGGDVGLDEFYHLSSDNNDNLLVLVGGGDTDLHYHSADRARANHTGTQLLATISDAGSMAYEDADDYLLKTGGVMSGRLLNTSTDSPFYAFSDSPTFRCGNATHGTDGRFGADAGGVFFSSDTAGGAMRLLAKSAGGVLANYLTISSEGNVLVNGFTAGTVGLTVKGAVGQSENLQEWQNSSGVAASGIDERGVPFCDLNTDVSNLFLGDRAGEITATGTNNVCIGFASGQNLTSGIRNTFVGAFSGAKTSSGNYNVGVGYSTLSNNSSGDFNVALGHQTMSQNVSGSGNLAVGQQALLSNTTGSGNLALMERSLRNAATNSSHNIAIGFQSLGGSSAIVAPYYDNISRNVGIGYQAGFTAGDDFANNTLIGYKTGYFSTGSNNVLIGYQAGYQLTTESDILVIANSDTLTPLIYGLFTGVGAGVTIYSQNAAGTPLNVQAIAGQTSPLLSLKNSSGSPQLEIAANGRDFILDTVTGTKFGTATNQKLAFWNKTPIVQPTNAIAAAAFVANSSGIGDDTATYGGYTIGQLAAIIINSGLAA